MLGHGQVLVDCRNVVGQDHREGIFLAVQRILLQSGIRFAPGHGNSVRAQCDPQLLMQLIFHDPDTQAGHVLNAVDLTHAVGQIAETGLPHAEALHADAGDSIHHLVADLTHENSVGMLVALDDIGQIEYAQFRDKVCQHADIDNGKVQIPQLDCLDAVVFVA